MSGLKSGVRLAQRFVKDQEAATAIEYAMIAAGIGATIASTVWALGSTLRETWWDKLAAMM